MKVPTRIYVPILIALVLGGAVGVTFLWQIHASIEKIESAFHTQPLSKNSLLKILPGGREIPTDSASQSQALMELRQGEIFEWKGEWKQAEQHYKQSVIVGGGVPALRKLASIQLQRREYDAAKDTIRSLQKESDSDDVILFEGILALRKGDIKGATDIFSRHAETPQGHYGLGLVAIASVDHETAKRELLSATQGNDPAIRTAAKVILSAFEEFLLFPEGQDVHLAALIAHALAQVSECETALPLVDTVVQAEGNYRDAWIVKGYCEFTTERTKDALLSLEQAYSLDPEKPEIQYFLARTHAALGDPQNAVTFLQYALMNGFQPEDDAHELLAEYALELGNIPLALEQYKYLANRKESTIRDYERYIELVSHSPEQANDALTLAKVALTRWPDDTRALTLSAQAAFLAGQSDTAEQHILKALHIDPKNTKAVELQNAIRQAKK